MSSVILTKINSFVSFTCSDPSVKDYIYKILTRETDEPGKPFLFYDEDDRFPLGLFNYVSRLLEKYGVSTELFGFEDPPDLPEIDIRLLSTPEEHNELRPHQVDSVRKMLYIKNCLIQGPPGCGKSEIVAAFLKILNKPSVTIVGQHKHAENMYNRLKRRGIESVGYISDGCIKESGKHYVAISDTVYSAMKKHNEEIVSILKEAEILIFDESHRMATAKSWQSICVLSNAKYKIGMSAYQFENPEDPYSNIGDMCMIALTGELVQKIPTSLLISEGFLCEPVVFKIVISSPYIHVPFDRMPQWQDFTAKNGKSTLGIYSNAIVYHEKRNEFVKRIAYNLSQNPNNRVLINVFRMDHGRLIIKMLTDCGVKCYFNSGGGNIQYYDGTDYVTPDFDETSLIEKFKCGEFRVLTGSCFTGDTMVPLLDGTEKSMEELSNQDIFEVYSVNPGTGFIEGAYAKCKKTKLKTEILEVTLDNGEKIKCTPDHRFMLRNGEYKEARDLVGGESLMPLYRRLGKDGYEELYEPVVDDWLATHRVQSFNMDKPDIPRVVDGLDKGGWVVHHGIESGPNKRDNRRSNLSWLRYEDHKKLHGGFGFCWLRDNDPEWVDNRRKEQRDMMLKRWESDSDFKTKTINALTENARSEAGKLVRKQNMLKYNKSDRHRLRTSELNSAKVSGYSKAWADPESSLKRRQAMSVGLTSKWTDPVYREKMLLQRREPKSQEYRDKLSFSIREAYRKKRELLNHKVVSVKPCGYDDVYDIEVEGYENFALSAGVFVHNCIFDECVDIPCLTDIILAAGMKTPRKQLQRIGRTMRPTESKTYSRVWDFQDNHCWVIKNHSNLRFRTYEEEGYQILADIPLDFLNPVPFVGDSSNG